MANKSFDDYIEPLRINGVGRLVEDTRMLCFAFNREPTDDEMRMVHDRLIELLNRSN